jgi:hypothetical protein
MGLEKFEKQIVGRKIDKLSRNTIYLEGGLNLLLSTDAWLDIDEEGIVPKSKWIVILRQEIKVLDHAEGEC